MAKQGYIHGNSPEEQERLEWMNRLLNAQELRELALAPGDRVLEMGAGTGVFARAMAERAKHVLAIELDEGQLRTARSAPRQPANLELRQGDAYEPPLRAEEWGSFDLVHARFLLEHLTRPAEAVAVFARAVRPGGRVVLVDDDHSVLRLWPPAPAFDELWRAYCDQYSARGMDPWIGRRLTGLAVGAGLEPRRATQLDFGACAGMETFSFAFDNLSGVVRGATEDILRSGALSAEQIEAGLREIDSISAAPDAALWYAVPFVEAVRTR